MADINENDQDSLTADEQALLKQMESDEGTDDGAGDPPPPPPPAAAKPKGNKAKAPAPAAKADGEGDGEGEGEGAAPDPARQKMVPHAALHEERLARQAADKRLEEAEKRFQTLEARTNLILEKLVPKEPEVKPEPIPDFETDPAGWIAHTMKSTGKELEDVKKELTTLREEKAQKTEQDKNTSVVRSIMDYAVTKENEFKAITPDYDEASVFLMESRKDELTELGYSEAEIVQMIQGEKLTIAAQAKQQGKNPAELVYNIAKRRGFAKKAAPPPLDADGQQDGDKGGATSAQKLEAARRGTEHAGSLSDTRGNAPSPLTVQRLLEMSEAEFAKAIETKEGKALLGS